MDAQTDLIYIIIGNLNNALEESDIEYKLVESLQANGKKYSLTQLKRTAQGDLYLAVWVHPRDMYSWYTPIQHQIPLDTHRQLNPLMPQWLCTPCVKCNNPDPYPSRRGGKFSSRGSGKIKYNLCAGTEIYITNLKPAISADEVAARITSIKAQSFPTAIDKYEFMCRLTFEREADRNEWLRLSSEQLGLFPPEWVLPGFDYLAIQAPNALSPSMMSEATATQLFWRTGKIESVQTNTSSSSTSSEPLSTVKAPAAASAPEEPEVEEVAEEVKLLTKVSDRVQIYESWVLGSGGAATVFAGFWDKFRAAIKKFDKSQILEAEKLSWLNEVEILMDLQSADATNIVRVFGFEDSAKYFYLAMEKCEFSLLDAIPPKSSGGEVSKPVAAALSAKTKDLREWVDKCGDDPNYYTRLTVLMRGFLKGLLVLHTERIIHRDISPGNLLFLRDSYNQTVPLIAKIADMHISNKLSEDQTGKYTKFALGKDGWKAPEILDPPKGVLPKATLRSDIFQAGMLLFYVYSGGHHLFQPPAEDGTVPQLTSFQIMLNITQNKNCLHLIERSFPELFDIVSFMVNFDPLQRPSVVDICSHPFVWSESTCINFLLDASAYLFEATPADGVKNIVRVEERAADLLQASVFHNWKDVARENERLDRIFTSLPAYSTSYNPHFPLHLLRFARNAIVHYSGLFDSREEAYRCIRSVFPHLLTQIWKIMDRMRPHSYGKYFSLWGGEIR